MNCVICDIKYNQTKSLLYHYDYHKRKIKNDNDLSNKKKEEKINEISLAMKSLRNMTKNENKEDNTYECCDCGQKSSNLFNYKRHVNLCFQKKEESFLQKLKDILNVIDGMNLNDTKVQEIRDIINKNNSNSIKGDKNIVSSINGNQNTTTIDSNNTYNINIKVNNFGEENYKGPLSDIEGLTELFNTINHDSISSIFTNLLNYVACNPKYPENHNLYIANKNRSEGIFNAKQNNKWVKSPIQTLKDIFKTRKVFSNYCMMYLVQIPDTLSKALPHKADAIDALTNKFNNEYSAYGEDKFLEKYWSTIVSNFHSRKDIIKNTMELDQDYIKQKQKANSAVKQNINKKKIKILSKRKN
tara:strand:+ start:149 stop:1219 length:1071 start_codon:yes stop_codon:yes gene_type:complete